MKPYKTIRQLCEENDLKKATVHYFIRSGKLKSFRIGKRHRILLTDWLAFLDSSNSKESEENAKR